MLVDGIKKLAAHIDHRKESTLDVSRISKYLNTYFTVLFCKTTNSTTSSLSQYYKHRHSPYTAPKQPTAQLLQRQFRLLLKTIKNDDLKILLEEKLDELLFDELDDSLINILWILLRCSDTIEGKVDQNIKIKDRNTIPQQLLPKPHSFIEYTDSIWKNQLADAFPFHIVYPQEVFERIEVLDKGDFHFIGKAVTTIWLLSLLLITSF